MSDGKSQEVKKGLKRRTEQHIDLNLNDENFMTVINCRVIPAAGHVDYTYNKRKGDLDELVKGLQITMER